MPRPWAAGKPVIVPDGTWMAGELKCAGGRIGVAYTDPRHLAKKLAEIVLDYDSFHHAAIEHSHVWSAHHSPETLVDQLATPVAQVDSPTGLASQGILV